MSQSPSLSSIRSRLHIPDIKPLQRQIGVIQVNVEDIDTLMSDHGEEITALRAFEYAQLTKNQQYELSLTEIRQEEESHQGFINYHESRIGLMEGTVRDVYQVSADLTQQTQFLTQDYLSVRESLVVLDTAKLEFYSRVGALEQRADLSSPALDETLYNVSVLLTDNVTSKNDIQNLKNEAVAVRGDVGTLQSTVSGLSQAVPPLQNYASSNSSAISSIQNTLIQQTGLINSAWASIGNMNVPLVPLYTQANAINDKVTTIGSSLKSLSDNLVAIWQKTTTVVFPAAATNKDIMPDLVLGTSFMGHAVSIKNVGVDNRGNSYGRVWQITLPDLGFDVIPFFTSMPHLMNSGKPAADGNSFSVLQPRLVPELVVDSGFSFSYPIACTTDFRTSFLVHIAANSLLANVKQTVLINWVKRVA